MTGGIGKHLDDFCLCFFVSHLETAGGYLDERLWVGAMTQFPMTCTSIG